MLILQPSIHIFFDSNSSILLSLMKYTTQQHRPFLPIQFVLTCLSLMYILFTLTAFNGHILIDLFYTASMTTFICVQFISSSFFETIDSRVFSSKNILFPSKIQTTIFSGMFVST